jgi:hypothetical protein
VSRLFISYSRKDETFARRLATDLSALGAQVWIDVDDIPPGMNWSRAIQQGLDTCEVLLLIISPDSMGSRNVEDEWNYFHTHHKPILPLLYREAATSYQLERVQHLDFREPTPGYAQGYSKLIAALAPYGVVAATPPTSATPPAPIKVQPMQRPTPDGCLNATAIIIAAIIAAAAGLVGTVLLIQSANQPTSTPAPIATFTATTLVLPSAITADMPTSAPTATTAPATTPPPVIAATSATAPTPAPTTAPTVAATIPASTVPAAAALSIERSLDLIAVCSPGLTAQVGIGTNELYTLIQFFTAQELARPGACVCLQRTANPALPTPTSCTANNTHIVSGADWRNNDMIIYVDAVPVLTCAKRPSERLYSCP